MLQGTKDASAVMTLIRDMLQPSQQAVHQDAPGGRRLCGSESAYRGTKGNRWVLATTSSAACGSGTVSSDGGAGRTGDPSNLGLIEHSGPMHCVEILAAMRMLTALLAWNRAGAFRSD